MREIRSSGSVGGRGGNDPPYPDVCTGARVYVCTGEHCRSTQTPRLVLLTAQSNFADFSDEIIHIHSFFYIV